MLIDQLSDDLCDKAECQRLRPRQVSESECDNMTLHSLSNYSWKLHLSQNSSKITSIFGGQLISTIECSVCHTQRHKFDPFYDLSLPFPEADPNKLERNRRTSGRLSFFSRMREEELSACTIEDCLRAFTTCEVLDDDNKTECRTCRKKQDSTKRLQVFQFPCVLVLHLKRFDNSRKKIMTSVDFPLEQFDAGSLAFDYDQVRNPNHHQPVYDLFGACHHSGRMNFGHYIA